MATIINASTSNGLIQSADTSGTLQLQSASTTKFTVDSTGAYGQIQSGTVQTTTSGTNIDFTSIPSWVKRITVMLNGVSTSGSSLLQIQLGTSSGFVTSGYNGSVAYIAGTSVVSNTLTTGLGTSSFNGTTDVRFGNIVITNITGNTWTSSATIALNASSAVGWAASSIALSGTLDRVRITTVNGTDTFDAGSINIMYEG